MEASRSLDLAERRVLRARRQAAAGVDRHLHSVTLLQRRKRGAKHDGFRGAPRAVIALWLGHESVETTQTYLHAHLALKEAALAKLKYEGAKRTRFRPNGRLLAFLDAL